MIVIARTLQWNFTQCDKLTRDVGAET